MKEELNIKLDVEQKAGLEGKTSPQWMDQMGLVPRPRSKLGLWPYAYAVEDLAQQGAIDKSSKMNLLLDMAGAIRRGELRVRNRDTGMPLVVTPDSESALTVFVTVEDVNSWLQAAGVSYTWKPKSIPAAAAAIESWVEKAKTHANKIGIERYASGIRQITAHGVCTKVAEELSKDASTHGIQGARTASNVRGVGLKGWKFSPPKEVAS